MKQIVSACFCILLLVSCGTTDTPGTTPGGKGDSTVQISLNPIHQSHYQYQVINSTEITQSAGNQKSDIFNSTDLLLDYEWSRQTDSLFLLRATYRRFRNTSRINGQDKVIDAVTAASSGNPSERMFAAFQDAVVQARINKNGEIVSVSGAEEMVRKMESLARQGQQADPAVGNMIRQEVNNTYFKSLFEQNFKILPSRPIREGDEWTSESTLQELSLPLKTKYRVLSINADEVVLASSADVDIEDRELTIQGQLVKANLEGRQEGEVTLDRKTGMITRSTMELDIKGDIIVMQMESAFRFKNKQNITRQQSTR